VRHDALDAARERLLGLPRPTAFAVVVSERSGPRRVETPDREQPLQHVDIDADVAAAELHTLVFTSVEHRVAQ
jgi:hypothetical protein